MNKAWAAALAVALCAPAAAQENSDLSRIPEAVQNAPIAQGRAAWGEPDFLKHMESVVMGTPNAEAILTRRRNALKAMKAAS